jgi:DNA-directed RNA polymerase subunit F
VADPLADAEMLSLPEVHDLLVRERASRGELSYEQRLALEHARAFDRLGSAEDAEALIEELTEVERVAPKQAIKIADLMPRSREELETVFSEDRQSFEDDDADTIMSIVDDYR